jgi:hypothetical protein
LLQQITVDHPGIEAIELNSRTQNQSHKRVSWWPSVTPT